MRYGERQGRDLLVGLVVSLLVHATGGLVMVRAVVTPAEEPGIQVLFENEDPEELRLGIERSDAQTDAWLGFDTPTEHAAPESATEQSAMTMAESGEAGDAAPGESPQETAPEANAEKAVVPEEAAEAARALAQVARDMVMDWLEAAQAVDVGDLARAIKAAPSEEAAEPREVAAGPAARPSPPTQGQPGSPGEPGIITDKEAAAAALKAAVTVVPGQVVAAEGLEISTRRPRWSRTTVMTRRPGNPVVWMTFGRDGRVRQAGFFRDGEREYRTGFPDVDEPLMNAVYQWTARGKALQDLPADRSDAGITVQIRVLLAG